jgi:hypothetical protein
MSTVPFGFTTKWAIEGVEWATGIDKDVDIEFNDLIPIWGAVEAGGELFGREDLKATDLIIDWGKGKADDILDDPASTLLFWAFVIGAGYLLFQNREVISSKAGDALEAIL